MTSAPLRKDCDSREKNELILEISYSPCPDLLRRLWKLRTEALAISSTRESFVFSIYKEMWARCMLLPSLVYTVRSNSCSLRGSRFMLTPYSSANG